MTGLKTYRHSKTGIVHDFDPRVALADPHLIEVPAGTKPLAYTRIPDASIEHFLEPVEPDESATPDDPPIEPAAAAPHPNMRSRNRG